MDRASSSNKSNECFLPYRMKFIVHYLLLTNGFHGPLVGNRGLQSIPLRPLCSQANLPSYLGSFHLSTGEIVLLKTELYESEFSYTVSWSKENACLGIQKMWL